MDYPRVLAAFLLTIPLIFGSCASKRSLHSVDELILPPDDITPVWEVWLPGVERSAWVGTDPPLRVWAVRIDLHNPDLEISVTPGYSEGAQHPVNEKAEVPGRRTSTALTEFGWDIAVNASPFAPFAYNNGTPQSVVGLAISGGIEYSANHNRYASILFESRNEGGYKSRIAAPPFNTDGVIEAAGGFFLILSDGKNDISNSKFDTERYPQTLAGLDETNRYLFLLVVDGRQPNWSAGLIPTEGAQWLEYYGASEGMMFDGGGSTTLVVRDETGGASVVNRPVDARIIGKERVVANHLGFTIRQEEWIRGD